MDAVSHLGSITTCTYSHRRATRGPPRSVGCGGRGGRGVVSLLIAPWSLGAGLEDLLLLLLLPLLSLRGQYRGHDGRRHVR